MIRQSFFVSLEWKYGKIVIYEKNMYGGRAMKRELDDRNVKWAFTHGGIFHADDVFAAALLRIAYPEILIERGNQVPEHYDGLIFDIGRGRYDHHQQDRKVRENGVPYASFGLLWQELGEMLLEKEDAERFDEEFVQPIDEADNTGKRNPLTQCISDLNPVWNEKRKQEEAFESAVAFAKTVLERRFLCIRAERTAYRKVRAMMKSADDHILIMEQAMPWKDALIGTDICYVIYPSIRGGYLIQAVPDDTDLGRVKKDFPEAWWGQEKDALQRMTGIKTLSFCHMSGFLCAAETLEDAILTAKQALR